MILAALLSLAIVNHAIGLASTDMIELNHKFDCKGELSFSQVIFWQWDRYENDYRCRAWTMIDDDRKWPVRVGDRMHVSWNDTANRMQRDVHAMHFRESWTQHDPEREDGRRLSSYEREGFSKR